MTVLQTTGPGDAFLELAARDPGSLELISGWLLERDRPATRLAYGKDIARLAAFLEEHGIRLLETTRPQVAAWAESMRRTVLEDGRRAMSEATIARRLSSASSFFTYATQMGDLEVNPVKDMKRPKRHADEDGIAWLDRGQMIAFLEAAQRHSRRAHAVVAVMLTTGARTSEVLEAGAADLGHTGGPRGVKIGRAH